MAIEPAAKANEVLMQRRQVPRRETDVIGRYPDIDMVNLDIQYLDKVINKLFRNQ
jgi:hypothetical protein